MSDLTVGALVEELVKLPPDMKVLIEVPEETTLRKPVFIGRSGCHEDGRGTGILCACGSITTTYNVIIRARKIAWSDLE